MTLTRGSRARRSSIETRLRTAAGLASGAFLIVLGAGCATVDVTKTAKGFYEPTRPDDVEILMSRPDRPYIELATVSTTNWEVDQTAKMHNAIRAKSAPLGAQAVLLTNSGVVVIHNKSKLWCTGFALKYKDAEGAKSENAPPQ